MAVHKVSGQAFMERYNSLKRQWFAIAKKRTNDKDEYDEHETVPAVTKSQLAKQFEMMGVQIPMTQDQPPEYLED